MRVNVLMTVMVRDKIVGNSRGPVSICCVFVFVHLRTLVLETVMVGRSLGSGICICICVFEDTDESDGDGRR